MNRLPRGLSAATYAKAYERQRLAEELRQCRKVMKAKTYRQSRMELHKLMEMRITGGGD